MSRSFIVLLGLTLFLGAGFGGSFIGGVIYGQTLEDDASELAPRLGTAGQLPGGGQGAGAGQRGQGRQGEQGGFAGGQAPGSQGQAPQPNDPGNLSGREGRRGQPGAAAAGQVGAGDSAAEAQADQAEPAGPEPAETTGTGGSTAQTNSATGSAAGGDGSPPVSGRGGVDGTVLSLEGDTLTVTSARGELTALLSDATTVYQISESSRDSLTSETRVRVIGSRIPEGGLAAQSVIITPAGAEGLFGAAGGPGGRRRGGGP
ncbi:MAG: hypothetical protein OXI91_04230 [Chloroflexota bacterium]|nr:hypothetical protein [Chloroflexota bacterium]